MVNQHVHQPERLRAADFAPQKRLQNLVVDAWEVFTHVALQRVVAVLHKMRQPVRRCVRPFAFAAGIRIVDKNALEDRLDDIAQRVMHHTVPVGRSAYKPGLGIIDRKGAIISRPVCMLDKLPLQTRQLRLKSVVECDCCRAIALATLRFARR